ncbi:NAD(P)H-dependent oxidoreductase [Flavobacteriaceae bacterium TP-CH-4]|uniref:NAD(P)H-dependent oxidoreductase n=1 Tax=Pelagihabitans pacificus TaxID=2696054 RepID=A0A967AY96_9FLAO|nr:NAD(P)H-dependent oxidoreductase [Pelagihabitans pacificus]NHF59802.1 NAD(P)H-dependent oxidoreductase [Pelagihabitans pacificus]
MKDSITSLEWRYAVKKFDSGRMLDDEQVEKLKQAFNLTATSYGLQPIKMMVLQNKEVQRALVAHSYGQEQVAQASHVLILCIENQIDARYISDYFEQVRKVRGTSEEILNPFKEDLVNSFSKKDVDEIKRWSTNQAYLAMGNLLTICALEKIDSCPMEGFVPEAYDALLGLHEKGLTSVLVLPIGYRAEDDMFADFKKVRKNLEESVIDIN